MGGIILRLLRKDSGGQIFTLDLLLALIPLTLIMGMAATNMDSMLYLTQSAVFQSSTERVAADTVNTLIGTSGSPYNWEHVGNPQVAGLARFDHRRGMPVENHLSPSKLAALQSHHIQSILGPEYGFHLNISRIDNRAPIKILGSKNNSAQNIIRIERSVVTSNLQVAASLEGLIRATGEPRVYNMVFQTNDLYVSAHDYWVLVINRGYTAASVDVNGRPVVTPDMFRRRPDGHYEPRDPVWINNTYLQNQTQFLDNVVTVRGRSAPGSSMDVYINFCSKRNTKK